MKNILLSIVVLVIGSSIYGQFDNILLNDTGITSIQVPLYETDPNYAYDSAIITARINTKATPQQIADSTAKVPRLYDYVIEEISGTVYARSYGTLAAYSDTNLTEVLNYIIPKLAAKTIPGGSIFIKSGLYDHLRMIKVTCNDLTIVGEGKFLTELKPINGLDNTTGTGKLFYIGAYDRFILESIELNGNGANQTYLDDRTGSTDARGAGVYATDSASGALSDDMLIMDCYIHDFSKHGILSRGARCRFENCFFDNNAWAGLEIYPNSTEAKVITCYFDNGSGLTVYGNGTEVLNCTFKDMYHANNWAAHNYALTIESLGDGPENVKVSGCTFEGDSVDIAIYGINSPDNLSIDNCRFFNFKDADGSGISLVGDTNTIISNIFMTGLTPGTYSGIRLSASYNANISNVTMTSIGYADIRLTGNASNNLIQSCNLRGVRGFLIDAGCSENIIMNSTFSGSTADITDGGTNTQLINNYSWDNDAWRYGGKRIRSTGTVVAGNGITTGMLSDILYFNTASAIDITANPQIVDGYNGQILTIIGSSDTDTLTLDDGTGLSLSGQCVLGVGDAITLIYSSLLDSWVETTRSNN